MRDRPTLLCLAHLGWTGVWQRPQQLLSRLATHYDVLYVHDPEIEADAEDPFVRRIPVAGDVAVWEPVMPDDEGVLRRWRAEYPRLVLEVLEREGAVVRRHGRHEPAAPIVVWLSSPQPVHALDHLPAALVVYDVMDELAAFAHAASDLHEREDAVLARADLVFAGGRSLWAARRDRRPDIHLLPSGVDARHFAAAVAPATVVAPEVAALPAPVLAFYGVVDERLDLALVDEVAAARPDWSVVMVGPVSKKIDARALPRRPNLHWTGPCAYERLPALLKGVDVAIMPFALTAATRFISPTKTLEFLAARRTVVSTPVPDVVASWGDVVRIAEGSAAFVAAVEDALGEDPSRRAARRRREDEILAGAEWDAIAATMHALVCQALRAPRLAP